GQCGGVCVPNAKQCNGKIPQTCDINGKWIDGTACPFVCAMATGVCGGVCVPADKHCAANNVPQTCDNNGQWQGTAVGGTGGICFGAAQCGECPPTTRRCMGNQPQLCNATGKWANDGGTCQFVCNNVTATCAGSCVPGSKQCNGNTPQTCDASGKFVND